MSMSKLIFSQKPMELCDDERKKRKFPHKMNRTETHTQKNEVSVTRIGHRCLCAVRNHRPQQNARSICDMEIWQQKKEK